MRAIPCPITPEELKHLYQEEKLTDAEIVIKIGGDASLKRVRSWRKRFGIPTIHRTERHEVTPIEGRLRSLLVGSMLGDGRLNRVVHTSRYVERHCDAQKAYLEWKVAQWGPWFKNPVQPVLEKHDGKEFLQWRAESVCHASLNLWQELFYRTGEGKSFPREVIDLVDSFALAVWYMDDGSTGWWPRITFGLDNESFQVCQAIFEKFSLNPSLDVHTETTKTFIFDGADQADHFIRLVRPHIPECMQHKLEFGFQDSRKYEIQKALTEPILRDYAARGVPIRRIAKELNESASVISRRLKAFGIEHPRKVGRPQTERGL